MAAEQTNPTTELIHHLRQPDLSILGNAIRRLPSGQWQERMFFFGAADTELKAQTGKFPATFRKDKTTHPIFILRAGTASHLACPCSTQGNRKRYRFIADGCKMEIKEQVMNRDSFLMEQYQFALPLDHRLCKGLRFFGKVPQHCLQDHRENHP